MIWNILPSLLSLLSILVAVFIFLSDRKRNKKVETIKELNKIFNQYYAIRDLDFNTHYKEYCALTSDISRFAYATLENIYDLEIVIMRASKLFLVMNDYFLEATIKKHREQFNNENYYREIEDLIDLLKM